MTETLGGFSYSSFLLFKATNSYKSMNPSLQIYKIKALNHN